MFCQQRHEQVDAPPCAGVVPLPSDCFARLTYPAGPFRSLLEGECSPGGVVLIRSFDFHRSKAACSYAPERRDEVLRMKLGMRWPIRWRISWCENPSTLAVSSTVSRAGSGRAIHAGPSWPSSFSLIGRLSFSGPHSSPSWPQALARLPGACFGQCRPGPSAAW